MRMSRDEVEELWHETQGEGTSLESDGYERSPCPLSSSGAYQLFPTEHLPQTLKP